MNIQALCISCSFDDLLQDTLEDLICGMQILTCLCYYIMLLYTILYTLVKFCRYKNGCSRVFTSRNLQLG